MKKLLVALSEFSRYFYEKSSLTESKLYRFIQTLS